jgi:hypothetical protein
LTQDQREYRYLLMALQLLGECAADLARVAIQGIRPENESNRGGIAAGLDRAAAYVRLKPFAPKPGGQPLVTAEKPAPCNSPNGEAEAKPETAL